MRMAGKYGEYLVKDPTHREATVHNLAPQIECLKLASYCVVDGCTDSEPAAPIEDQGIRRFVFVFAGQDVNSWV